MTVIFIYLVFLAEKEHIGTYVHYTYAHTCSEPCSLKFWVFRETYTLGFGFFFQKNPRDSTAESTVKSCILVLDAARKNKPFMLEEA